MKESMKQRDYELLDKLDEEYEKILVWFEPDMSSKLENISRVVITDQEDYVQQPAAGAEKPKVEDQFQNMQNQFQSPYQDAEQLGAPQDGGSRRKSFKEKR